MMVNGKIYGFPDDGDVFVMYYRKDMLGDPRDFRRPTRRSSELRPAVPPTNWKEFDQVGQLHHRIHQAASLYGAAFFREAGYGNFMFQERFRNEGGKFFDAETMKATINSRCGRQGPHRLGRGEQVGCRRASSSGASSKTSPPSCRARRR